MKGFAMQSTTVKMSPTELASIPSEGDGFLSMQMQGVCTTHRLYCEYSDKGNTYFYLRYPESGSYEGMQRWYGKDQDVKTWEVPHTLTTDQTLKAMREIHEYVLGQSMDEVAQEMI